MMHSKAALLARTVRLTQTALIVPAFVAATTASAPAATTASAPAATTASASAAAAAKSALAVPVDPAVPAAPSLLAAPARLAPVPGAAVAIPATPPGNDTCAGAEVIPACGPFPKLTTAVQVSMATPEGDPSPGCQRNAAAGVWYSFTPATTGTYRFTTCQNLAPSTAVEDTVLALFQSRDNRCPEGARIACNDNDSECAGHEHQSTLRASLTEGRTYFILAYTVGSSPGGIIQVQIDREAELRQCADTDLDGTLDPCLPNGGFEMGILEGWMTGGMDADVAVVPKDPPPICFQPDMPSEGCFMACLSNGNFFGGAANGDVRSDLVSEPINFAFRPGKIEVSFTVEFQTEEDIPSIGSNDAFQARLVTSAGTFVILQIDTFGRTPPGRGLRVDESGAFSDTAASCPIIGHRTRLLKVAWTKPVDPTLRNSIQTGPVFLEFSVSDQGNPERTSIACVDDVRIKIGRPTPGQ